MRHRLRNPAQTSPSHVLGCVHARASARSNALRLLFALTLFVASTFSHAALVAVAPAGSDDFAVAPGWRAVDFNLFAASVGLLPAAELLPAATHVDLAGLGIGAGEAQIKRESPKPTRILIRDIRPDLVGLSATSMLCHPAIAATAAR